MNYDTMGGLAEHRPEIAVTQDEVEVITSHCIAYLAACGMEGAHDLPVTPEVRACLTRLEEMTPLQVASVFKAAKKTNPDILSFDQAMRDYENLKEWLAAALKEITQLEEKKCWEEIRKSEAKGKIVPCTWVFRCKRNPAGEIIKCKARICLRGDLMDDDEESYAPVVSWSSIRLFLVIAIILGWTAAVSYTHLTLPTKA